MRRYLTNYLLFTSLIVLGSACSTPYKSLRKTTGDPACIQKFKPVFESVMYNTTVDIVGHHISGVLLFKMTPDSSIRVVFSMKTGLKFFDFGFTPDSGFKVYFILKQMDKKPLIKALRKDFELILLQHTEASNGYLLSGTNTRYYAFPQEKGTNYYITDTTCSELIRMEKSSKRKVIVEAVMKDYREGTPDTVGISHKKFNFVIAMKKLEHAAK
jgi:hypothetical protein